MHAKYIDLHRLSDLVLTSITIATNNIRLSFAKYPLDSAGAFIDQANIDVEAGFCLTHEHVRIEARQADGLEVFRCSAGALLRLIEKSTNRAELKADGGLEIDFDDGSKLLLVVDHEGFDSYHVHQPQR